MELTRENILTIARLARLKIPEERVEPYRQDLTHILKWIDQLNELHIQEVEPMFSVFLDEMPRREDVVADGGIVKDIVSNAPGGAQFDMFVVPKVVE